MTRSHPTPCAFGSVVLLLALVATPARADRRELYVAAGPAAVLVQVADPLGAGTATRALAPAATATVFYGLTNELHVGLAFHGSLVSNLAFPGLAPELPDQSRPTGTLYEDLLTLGGGPLVHYRLDTGFPFAPFAEAELGLTYTRISNIQHNPVGTQLGIPLPSRAHLAFSPRVAAGFAFRFGDSYVLQLGLGARFSAGATTRWQAEIPLLIAYVW